MSIYLCENMSIQSYSLHLDAEGEPRTLNAEKGRWHSLESQTSDSVLYESKEGPYHPLEEDEVMKK